MLNRQKVLRSLDALPTGLTTGKLSSVASDHGRQLRKARFSSRVAVSLIFVVSVVGLNEPVSAEPSAKAPAKSKAPPATKPQQAEPEKSQFAPVAEAQKKGVKTCLPMLNDLSRLSITGPHTSVISWNNETPNERMFTALSFSSATDANAAHFASVISATPSANGHCDGGDVRIEAAKQGCEDIARDLQRQNYSKPDVLNGTLLYPTNPAGQRLVLLPAAASGCVVITTGGYYGR